MIFLSNLGTDKVSDGQKSKHTSIWIVASQRKTNKLKYTIQYSAPLALGGGTQRAAHLWQATTHI